PRLPFKDIFAHLLPTKLADEVRSDPEYRAQLANLLGEIEEERESEGGINDEEMRKEIQAALK
ncbi:MAG TPA: hypothetical protein VI796_05830, partial [Candidatus Thermoplasmatota archaeon]|nr:hypothetical protein [Candidatus Thermoplasmatota archaeon]